MTDGDDAPSKVARFIDVGLVPVATDEAAMDPREIVALVFESPMDMDHRWEMDRTVPLDKALDIDLTARPMGVMNKLTPEMLLAVVANIIATSPNARVAVARLRNEVLMWRFQRADGTVE